MDHDGDVEMASTAHRDAPTKATVLALLSSGSLDALEGLSAKSGSATTTGSAETTAEENAEVLAPFLPLLTRLASTAPQSAPRRDQATSQALSRTLSRFDRVNDLRAYTVAVQTLTASTFKEFIARKQQETQTSDGNEAPTRPLPVYRQFESGSPSERCCLVLEQVLQGDASAVDNELFRNAIYTADIAAILVNLLAQPDLEGVVDRPAVVAFSLRVPIGVDLVEALVLNDPSCFQDVLTSVVQSIHTVDLLASTTQQTQLPFAMRQAQATCLALAQISPLFATQVMNALKSADANVAAVLIAFQLLLDVPALRETQFYSTFLLQWMKSVSTRPNSKLASFLQVGLRPASTESTENESADAVSTAGFHEEARYQLSQLRQVLCDEITQFQLTDSTRSSTLVRLLHVLVGLLVLGQLHPEDHETTQLLRCFDRLAKYISTQQTQPPSAFERLVSVMYVLVVLLCAPSAPLLSKIPSQREDSTKLVLQLAQQSIFSLYNTKAACPLFILSSVLLYTKSTALLPFLSSLFGDAFSFQAHTRLEYLFGVGDSVLKPILTENVMAREMMTAFSPVTNCRAHRLDQLEEMTLRCLHGLLTEKSFLRHHAHARKLEEWMVAQLEQASLPVHALLTSILLEWIENYVVAFEYPVAQRPLLQLAIIPLRPAILSRVLSHKALRRPFQMTNEQSQRAWASASLVLVYALQFNQRMRQAMSVAGSKLNAFANRGNKTEEATPAAAGAAPATPVPPPVRGSADIVLSYELHGLPIAHIYGTIVSQSQQSSALKDVFEFVTPTLHRLIAEEYPHLVSTLPLSQLPSILESEDHVRLLTPVGSTPSDALPCLSWLELTMWMEKLSLSSPLSLQELMETVLDVVLPVAVLHASSKKEESSVDVEAFFTAFAKVYLGRVRLEHTDPDRLRLKIAHVLCVPQLVWKHYQHQLLHQRRHPGQKLSTPRWITHEGLVEQPFYLLQHAVDGASSSPSLLRVVLSLVQDLRDQSIVQIFRRDPSWLATRKAPIANTGTAETPSNGVVMATGPTIDSAAQQYLLVQDCILVHTLLSQLKKLLDREQEESIHLVCSNLEILLDEQRPGASSAQLALTVHIQGYDVALVPVLVTRVKALQSLWQYWIQPPSNDASANRPSSSRHGSGGGSNSQQNKALIEYVIDGSTFEKDLPKLQFRLRVFFLLCGRYFVSAQSSVVVPTIKQVLNKLRGIAVSTVSSGRGAQAMSASESTSRIAFVDTVLRDAVDACGQHGELRSEVAQFLLNLKKHVGNILHHNGNTQENEFRPPNIGPADAAHTKKTPGQELENVIARAYQRVLASL
ncbi:hypothetical protein Poli38472_013138 [Pythium oligandrum]|uniref:Uncharacterized protein n=1 Tax=Pythium oligandrum TaxID=41045 RepID=A0A8K1FD66_PYTOL|nr:hypothetical protein Poli38472_013138 [Pythium oligandrum]|eukprot:TMW55247.1 hypothetical protein Poli38472_013138 [Pythium oligandrum]